MKSAEERTEAPRELLEAAAGSVRDGEPVRLPFPAVELARAFLAMQWDDHDSPGRPSGAELLFKQAPALAYRLAVQFAEELVATAGPARPADDGAGRSAGEGPGAANAR